MHRFAMDSEDSAMRGRARRGGPIRLRWEHLVVLASALTLATAAPGAALDTYWQACPG
jgi:hypothetical protein